MCHFRAYNHSTIASDDDDNNNNNNNNLYGTTALQELWPPCNEAFFIQLTFIYTYFRLEAERWVISP